MSRSLKSILFIVPQLGAGGSERVIFELARGLTALHYEVYVVAFSGGALADQMQKVSKHVFIIRKTNRVDINCMLELARIIKIHKIDVINAHHYISCLYSYYGAKLANRRLLFFTEHSVPEVERVAKRFHKQLLRFMLSGIDRVIGVSNAITFTFSSIYPQFRDRFITIQNGVDIEKFQRRNMRPSIREEWGFDKETFLVGMVGNFRKIKNHACLVRAAALLAVKNPRLKVLIVGSGLESDAQNSEPEVRALIERLGLSEVVILAGHRDNIPELLSMFDAFCLPSFSEGLPVSILEAMAAGVPIIGSDVRGISELIKHGKTGLLFDSDNELALSDRIQSLISEPTLRESLVAEASRYILDYSYDQWIARYRNLFFQD